MEYGKGRVSIVGLGNLGQGVAKNIYEGRAARQIVGYGNPESDPIKVDARLKEIRDSQDILGPELIRGEYVEESVRGEKIKYPKDLEDSETVIITAGVPKHSEKQSRMELAGKNGYVVKYVSEMIKYAAENSKKYNEPKVLIASNPSEVMTEVALVGTGYDPDRVIGLNGIDTRRVINDIRKHLKLTGTHMGGYVLGPHSNKMIIPLEAFTIGGTSLEDYLYGIGQGERYKWLQEHMEKLKEASTPIITGLGGSPWYGPAKELYRLQESIWFGAEDGEVGTTNNALVRLTGQYNGLVGITEVPIVLRRKGVRKVIELKKLTANHYNELKESLDETNLNTKIILNRLYGNSDV